jgi:hypothetical protein
MRERLPNIPVFYPELMLAEADSLINTMRECVRVFTTARVLDSARCNREGAGEVT